jgi:hypothetical protein
VVGLRFSFDPDHLPEPPRGLALLVRHPFYHQIGPVLFEVVFQRHLADCLSSVLGHPCLDPTLARLFDAPNTYPLFLLLGNRDWRNRSLLQSHVEMIDGEATVISSARLGLSPVLPLGRGRDDDHHDLLLSSAGHGQNC